MARIRERQAGVDPAEREARALLGRYTALTKARSGPNPKPAKVAHATAALTAAVAAYLEAHPGRRDLLPAELSSAWTGV